MFVDSGRHSASVHSPYVTLIYGLEFLLMSALFDCRALLTSACLSLLLIPIFLLHELEYGLRFSRACTYLVFCVAWESLRVGFC